MGSQVEWLFLVDPPVNSPALSLFFPLKLDKFWECHFFFLSYVVLVKWLPKPAFLSIVIGSTSLSKSPIIKIKAANTY